MKKVFAAIMALVMVFSLSATAFAAGQGDETQNVTATYTPKAEDAVYSVDITWGSLSFTYTESTGKVWKADTHTYTDAVGSWDKTEASITVTNHSNVAVDVTVSYKAQDTGVTGTVTNGSKTLNAGVEGKPSEADAMTATLTISGKPTASGTTTIGSITITIA